MGSSQFKPQRTRGDRKPSRALVALPASVTEPIAKRYAAGLNQHEQSLVYREHCATISAGRPKRKPRNLVAKPWSPPVSNRECGFEDEFAAVLGRVPQCIQNAQNGEGVS